MFSISVKTCQKPEP